MKKEIKVVAIVLAALIIFLSGFGLGATKGINVNVNVEGGAATVGGTPATQPTQAPATQPTQAPATQPSQAPTQAPAGNDDTTKAPEAEKPAGDSKIPATTEEIVAAYNKAINDTRNYKGTVQFKKDSVISIAITDCPGGSTVANILQPIIDDLAGSSTWSATYNDGVNEGGGYLTNAVIPGDRDAALTTAGVANASATAAGDGYKMTITLVPEKSTFDGTNTTYPVHHQSIMNPLNLATLDIPLTITAADMSYAGATVEATVDGEGRVTLLTVKMPLEGSGTGKAGFITATVGIAGSLDDTYTLTY